MILLFLLAFPQVIATYFKAVSSPTKKYTLLAQPQQAFTNDFGSTETLPNEASDALRLAAKHQLPAFFLSDGITKDELIYQRIIEALYPLVPTLESPFIFFKIDENMLAGCDLLEETTVVKLARCV